MSIVADIFASYRRPRRIARQKAGAERREDRALAFLMAGCGLMFLAQWPALSRAAVEAPQLPLDQRIGGALLGWLFIMPLVMYAVAGLTHVCARMFGGQGSWYSARIALFWALLASTPLWLLNGLTAGFVGPGPAMTGTGLLASVAFFFIWLAGLAELEWGDPLEQEEASG